MDWWPCRSPDDAIRLSMCLWASPARLLSCFWAQLVLSFRPPKATVFAFAFWFLQALELVLWVFFLYHRRSASWGLSCLFLLFRTSVWIPLFTHLPGLIYSPFLWLQLISERVHFLKRSMDSVQSLTCMHRIFCRHFQVWLSFHLFVLGFFFSLVLLEVSLPYSFSLWFEFLLLCYQVVCLLLRFYALILLRAEWSFLLSFGGRLRFVSFLFRVVRCLWGFRGMFVHVLVPSFSIILLSLRSFRFLSTWGTLWIWPPQLFSTFLVAKLLGSRQLNYLSQRVDLQKSSFSSDL